MDELHSLELHFDSGTTLHTQITPSVKKKIEMAWEDKDAGVVKINGAGGSFMQFNKYDVSFIGIARVEDQEEELHTLLMGDETYS